MLNPEQLKKRRESRKLKAELNKWRNRVKYLIEDSMYFDYLGQPVTINYRDLVKEVDLYLPQEAKMGVR